MDWLGVFGFELGWRKEVERAVEALAIVAGLDVIKEGGFGFVFYPRHPRYPRFYFRGWAAP